MKIYQAYLQLRDAAIAQHGESEANRIARYLLEDLYQITNIHKLGELDTTTPKFQSILQQLSQNRPWQYIAGVAHFYGDIFQVDERVLIPRPETEELVEQILHHPAFQKRTHLRLLDIGTGSGCIPISIKKQRPHWEVWASDISGDALAVAQKNAASLAAPIHFIEQNILDRSSWEALPQFDIIVSNPPYIPTHEKNKMPAHVLDWEPHLALFTTSSPLEFYEAITDFAHEKLLPDGGLFFELNEFQAQACQQMIQNKGWHQAQIIQDLSGKDRMLVALLDVND